MKITRRQLRQIIKEELEILAEKVVPLDAFPDPDMPPGGKADIALNGKINSLMAAVIYMNDNAVSKNDLDTALKKVMGVDTPMARSKPEPE